MIAGALLAVAGLGLFGCSSNSASPAPTTAQRAAAATSTTTRTEPTSLEHLPTVGLPAGATTIVSAVHTGSEKVGVFRLDPSHPLFIQTQCLGSGTYSVSGVESGQCGGKVSSASTTRANRKTLTIDVTVSNPRTRWEIYAWQTT